MSTTIAVVNEKGGTGKTTTAVTLGYGLAARGKRTLIVDLDPMGQVAVFLGHRPAPGVFDLLVGRRSLEQVVVRAREEDDLPLFIVPSDHYTRDAEMVIDKRVKREEILARALRGADYDVIIIDVAPYLSTLLNNALEAAQWLLIPVKLDGAAIAGMGSLMAYLVEMQREGITFNIMGIIPTFWDRVTVASRNQLQLLARHFPELLLPPIPVDAKLRLSVEYGQTIWEFDPESRAVVGVEVRSGRRTGGYAKLLERVLEVIEA